MTGTANALSSSFLSLLIYSWTIIFSIENEFITFIKIIFLRNFNWDHIEFINYLGET